MDPAHLFHEVLHVGLCVMLTHVSIAFVALPEMELTGLIWVLAERKHHDTLASVLHGFL